MEGRLQVIRTKLEKGGIIEGKRERGNGEQSDDIRANQVGTEERRAERWEGWKPS